MWRFRKWPPEGSRGTKSSCDAASFLCLPAGGIQPFIIQGTMNGTGNHGNGGPGNGNQAVDDTNVVRVAFGVRRARRRRPERPDHWATLVIPFQAAGGGRPTPPHAA
jgi:hypothetical protein